MAGSAADTWEVPLKITPVTVQQGLQLDPKALDVLELSSVPAKPQVCGGRQKAAPEAAWFDFGASQIH